MYAVFRLNACQWEVKRTRDSQKAVEMNRQQWGILDNDRSIDSVIRERVPANIRASSRGKTEGASVIHKEKVSKGCKV